MASAGPGGDRGGHNRDGRDQQQQRKPKETLFDLGKYLDRMVHVKFVGGREASGILKGYDALLNLVLDETSESGRGGDSDDSAKAAEEKRSLGLVVCRGPSIVMLCPDGMEPISNPFVSE